MGVDRWGKGAGVGSPALIAVRCSAVCVATAASSRSLSARARTARSVTLAPPALAVSASSISRDSLCIDSLRHLVYSCETLIAELCLEIVDGVTRVHQLPSASARRGLLPKGLPGGVQLLKARAAVTMNDSDGNVAIARKLTPLMWPVGRGVRMRQVGYSRRFPVEAKRTSHLKLSCA